MPIMHLMPVEIQSKIENSWHALVNFRIRLLGTQQKYNCTKKKKPFELWGQSRSIFNKQRQVPNGYMFRLLFTKLGRCQWQTGHLLHLLGQSHTMPDKFFCAVAKTYPVQCIHDWTALERLRPGSLSDLGHTTFRSGAEKQRAVSKIVPKIAFLMQTEVLSGTVFATLQKPVGYSANTRNK